MRTLLMATLLLVLAPGLAGAQPPRPQVHCCNRKGALVGAAVGAALGALLTRSLCDAGDGTKDYLESTLVLGGIGAGLGALIHKSPNRPLTFPEQELRLPLTISGRARRPIIPLHSMP